MLELVLNSLENKIKFINISLMILNLNFLLF
jgi:hypothetical protein